MFDISSRAERSPSAEQNAPKKRPDDYTYIYKLFCSSRIYNPQAAGCSQQSPAHFSCLSDHCFNPVQPSTSQAPGCSQQYPTQFPTLSDHCFFPVQPFDSQLSECSARIRPAGAENPSTAFTSTVVSLRLSVNTTLC